MVLVEVAIRTGVGRSEVRSCLVAGVGPLVAILLEVSPWVVAGVDPLAVFLLEASPWVVAGVDPLAAIL
jgi:hypothetical protein